MKIRPLLHNLEYALPEIHCYLNNLQQRRLSLVANLLPTLSPQPVRPSPYRLATAPLLLPRELRPFIVLRSTYRID